MKRLGVLTVIVGVVMVSSSSAEAAHGQRNSVVGGVTGTKDGVTLVQEFSAFSDPDDAGPSGRVSAEASSAAGRLGSITSHVSCLRVSGNQATVGIVVDRSTGLFAGFLPPGTAFLAFVEDNGAPVVGQAIDYTEGGLNADPTGATCPATKHPFMLESAGNLSVNGA